MTSLVQQEIELEHGQVEKAIQDYRKAVREGRPLGPHYKLMQLLMPYLEQSIAAYIKSRKKGHYRHIKDSLRALPVAEVAYVVMQEVVLGHGAGQTLQTLAKQIGTGIANQLEYNQFKQENPSYLRAVEKAVDTQHQTHRMHTLKHARKRVGVPKVNISQRQKFDIGYKLIHLLIESTGAFELTPGHKQDLGQKSEGKTQYILQAAPETKQWLEKAHKKCETMSPRLLPMVVPPKDWSTIDDGGYYTINRKLVLQTVENQANIEPSQTTLDTINTLQRVPWSINTRILDTAFELHQREYKLGVMASKEDVQFPLKPFSDDVNPNWPKENPEAFKQWKKKMSAAYAEQTSKASKVMDAAQILQTANRLRDYEAIYFPWSMDFRGRLYPIPPYLQIQGEDLAKGLLQFSEGKPLGESGAYWLAIHGANHYGNDKVSLDERVRWVNENEQLICDSAYDPLGGEKFWTEADDPWQFLAFCFEWAGYKMEGPEYVSHLCVSVDGSCNGLQHFSALLRDEHGGAAVNLKNQDERQDIYNIVAQKVAKEVHKDAQNGHHLASLWDGKIDRSVVKRNVMTIPYGVTRRGMGDQIAQEQKYNVENEELRLEIFKAAAYLGEKVYDVVGEIIPSAIQGMDYLKEVVSVFNSAGMPISWDTPVGQHVEQYKIQTQTKRIDTYHGSQRIQLSLKEPREHKLHASKQKSGIAPNLIHSLDAAHLALTVRRCREQGVSHFGMVHDSFGTHAVDMDTMYHTLRETFVEIYQRDVLAETVEQFKAQLPEEYHEELPELPTYGNLDVSEVRSSEYFFA